MSRSIEHMFSDSLRRIGRLFQNLGNRLVEMGGVEGTWIDVGAHCGETSLGWAVRNPGLKVYAFEANISVAASLIGRAPNYFVVPMAVAENNGIAEFRVNAIDMASSLLPLNEAATRTWIGGDGLRVASVVTVPAVRLDTFMDLVGISTVDFLKVDAQGADLAVLRSAGSRLKDVHKVTLEADVTQNRLYEGSAGRDEIMAYLEQHGFKLADVETQSSGQEQNLTFVNKNTAGMRR